MKDKCRIWIRTCVRKRVPYRPGIDDIYLCAALNFDLRYSWLSMAFEVLSIIIHVIIAVASLFASMAIPGNTIDPH